MLLSAEACDEAVAFGCAESLDGAACVAADPAASAGVRGCTGSAPAARISGRAKAALVAGLPVCTELPDGCDGLMIEIEPPVAFFGPRAMLITAPASPEWVLTLTQVLRSTATAIALPVTPECPMTLGGVPAPCVVPKAVASAFPLSPEVASTVA